MALAEGEELAGVGVEDTTPDALWHAKTEEVRIAPGTDAPVDDEDDVVPCKPLRADRADTVVPAEGIVPPGARRGDIDSRVVDRRSLLDRVRQSPLLQLLLLSALGIGVLAYLFSADEREKTVPELAPVPTFPKLDIEGAPRVTEKEIARRMRMAELRDAEARAEDKREVSFSDLKTDEEKRSYLKAVAAAGRKQVLGTAEGDLLLQERRVRSRASDNDEDDPGVDELPRVPKREVFRWYIPGGTVKIEGANEEKEEQRLPLGVGDRLSAKLEVGISSGHGAPVLARLSKDVESGGRVVAPKGAMLKGHFRADALRIYVTFEELILAGGDRLFFEGYAVDRKVPGLLATRREVEGGEPGKVVLEETVDVAKEVVRSVTGGTIVGRVTDGVAEGVLPDRQTPEQAGFILEVPAGKRFEIVVTKGGKS